MVAAVVAALAVAPQLTVSGVQAQAQTATVSWRATAPTRVVLKYESAPDYWVWSKPAAGAATSGKVVLGGLEPSRTYSFQLLGQANAVATGSFTTARISGSTSATITKNALLLNGEPLFPRMVFQQCPWAYNSSLTAGINLFMGSCGDDRGLPGAVGGRAFSVLSLSSRGSEGRGLVGYYQQDEADGLSPIPTLPQLPSSTTSRRVTFLTLTNHFFSAAAPLPAGRSIYPKLISRAEMIGFDLYPLQNWCRKSALSAVWEAQAELVELAAGKPTYQWIEAGPMNQCFGLDPSPAIVRAETWLAIAGGARGIGFFPDYWKPDVAREVGYLSDRIASLSPALLADARSVNVMKPPVRAGARSYNGATYIIAVNPTFSRMNATFTVPGLGTGLIWPVGEGRSVPIKNGRFSDYFRGLAVHIYVAPAPSP